MPDVLAALVGQREPVPLRSWRRFWDQLDAGRLAPGEAAAVLAVLSTRMPGRDTVTALLASLDERRQGTVARFPSAVNIVGTGGGPKTFNISTASAFLAAAMGVPVVKTGARAYTSSYGSVDLLHRLGVRLTVSYADTGEVLDRFGIAFAGRFVYPTQLAQLARAVYPLELKVLAGVINTLGPFLAAMPVGAQLTGVSEPAVLPLLRHLASARREPRTWLCTNDLGVDELVSHCDNVVHSDEGRAPLRLRRHEFGPAPGTMADLRPVAEHQLVGHFLDVLSGQGPPVAAQTVCLNAAALAVAGGVAPDWPAAAAAAGDTLTSGAAVDLVERMRTANRLAGVGRRG